MLTYAWVTAVHFYLIGDISSASDGGRIHRDLDLLLNGLADSGRVAKIVRNDGVTANTPPTAPAGLNVAAGSSGVGNVLSWTPAEDAQTPTPGLSYNLYIGTTAGDDDVAPAMADLSGGLRRIVEIGPIQGTTWTASSLPAGTYYWSVQAIDAALAGSPWGTEQTFTIGNSAPVAAADAYITDENTPLVIGATTGVLANDSDLNGDTLIVTAVDTSGIPAGELTWTEDGAFTYDPNGELADLAPGETTTGSAVYTVSDGNGGTDTGTVTVTIHGAANGVELESVTVLVHGWSDGLYVGLPMMDMGEALYSHYSQQGTAGLFWYDPVSDEGVQTREWSGSEVAGTQINENWATDYVLDLVGTWTPTPSLSPASEILPRASQDPQWWFQRTYVKSQ